jgi:hypothetical protein
VRGEPDAALDTAEQRDEFAPFHSITSSARASTSTPNAFCGRTLYPAGPAAILHRPDPIMIVAEPSFVIELA